MALNCEECMKGAPYVFCCKRECNEHEFCRNCTYKPESYEKYCFNKSIGSENWLKGASSLLSNSHTKNL